MLAAHFPCPRMTAPHYTTHDPYLASFAVSQGIPLAGCKRLGPKKVEFRFEAGPRLHGLLRLYWSGVPVFIAPAQLLAALRHLKSRSLTHGGRSSSVLPS